MAKRYNTRGKTIKYSKQSKSKVASKKLSKKNQFRIRLVFTFVVLCFAGLAVRLIQINVVKGQTYEKKVMSLFNYDGKSIPYKRGDIKDRNGTVLATSEKIYNLVLDPQLILSMDIEDADVLTAELLSEYFEIDADEVEKAMTEQSESHYVVLKRKLTYDEKKPFDTYVSDTVISTSSAMTDEEKAAATREDNKLKIAASGIWFEENYKRTYPFSTLACDLIGFTSSDNNGLWGLESYYNDTLSGVNGRQYNYLDDEIDLQKVTQEPENGKNVVSTIDVNIQRIAEKYIAQFVDTVGAKNVAAIVMNPNNGEILAMASAPVFNLNAPQDLTVAGYTQEQLAAMTLEDQSNALNSTWRNFCVNDTFEPGSTAKTMTVSYALDQDLVKDSDTFDCDGGNTYSDGTWVSCNSVHGLLTLKETIMHSCNDAMMQISDKMGTSSFVKMQNMFGLGQVTGIDLPGEASCATTLYNADNMGPVERWTSSFGQGFNTTMVQIASAFSSIVNGGEYYRPHVVSQVVTDTGSTVAVYDKTLMRTTVSKATSDWMLDTLYKTVEDGSATAAAVSGYKIGGKTGTAEKLPRGTDARLVSFIGVAPIDDPQIVVYVVVDEANAEDQGQSSFASNIAGQIFKETLPYLQIFPTEAVSESESDTSESDAVSDGTTDGGTTDAGTTDDGTADGEDADGEDAYDDAGADEAEE